MTRIGVAGYGFGGHIFHVPFIQATDELELVGVVTRNPERRALLELEAPGVRPFDSLADLLAAGVDLVTLTTPPETRRDLVIEALDAGVNVIADKPFAPDAETARELVAAAERAGKLLTVFHNRRWDTDLRTLASVLERGELGEVRRIVNRFDLDEPGTLEAGPAHGLLRDLGSHTVDQAVHLLGPVARVFAHLDYTEVNGYQVDSGFEVSLVHESGAHSTVSSTKLNRLAERELIAYGTDGSYVSRGRDVQTAQLIAGDRPATFEAVWGAEKPELWGTLRTEAGERRIPTVAGNYADFYRGTARALRDGTPPPVTAREALHVVEVLDAARLSATEGRSVDLVAEHRNARQQPQTVRSHS
ncbi:MAG: Gfo/Idh/MocA family protein [Pseudoclavibacter sp.]